MLLGPEDHKLTGCRRFDLLMNVHPAETFPLALGGAIVIQQLAFVAVQSTALNSVLVSGCGGVAQILFPSTYNSVEICGRWEVTKWNSDIHHRIHHPNF